MLTAGKPGSAKEESEIRQQNPREGKMIAMGTATTLVQYEDKVQEIGDGKLK